MKRLQGDPTIELPEGTLYLDPDIIDLTMLPPPITPDEVSIFLKFEILILEVVLKTGL